jgi:hypothetical protein
MNAALLAQARAYLRIRAALIQQQEAAGREARTVARLLEEVDREIMDVIDVIRALEGDETPETVDM